MICIFSSVGRASNRCGSALLVLREWSWRASFHKFEEPRHTLMSGSDMRKFDQQGRAIESGVR